MSIRGVATPPISQGLINADFRINQRGQSSYSFADQVYTLDRWQMLSVTGGGTAPTGNISQQSFTPGTLPGEPSSYLRINNTSQGSGLGANSYFIISQPIESVRTFAGQTVTVGFYARSDISAKTIGVGFSQSFGSGGSADLSINGQSVTLTTSWKLYFATFSIPSIAGKTIGTNDYLRLSFWTQAGSNFAAQAGGAISWQGTGNTEIAEVRIVPGAVLPGVYDRRPVAQELALCQRYYEEILFNWQAYQVGNTVTSLPLMLKATKRSIPTISRYNFANVNCAFNSFLSVNQSSYTFSLLIGISAAFAIDEIHKISAEF